MLLKVSKLFLTISSFSFFQLSPAELEKRRLRRERNKLAAFKCRQRRKEHMQELEDVSGLFTLQHLHCLRDQGNIKSNLCFLSHRSEPDISMIV